MPQVVRRRAPLFKHLNIRTHVFKKLALLPGIVGLIYQGEMRRFLNYHYAAANRLGFAFYEADETNFLTRPGAWGVLSAGAQLLPGAWQRVTRACLHPEEAADDQERRFELWNLSQRLLEIARLCHHRTTALLKTALAAQGVLPTATAAPDTAPATPLQSEDLLALVASLAG
jgi:dihydrodipicolinate synthase/N-acetylneuraminate lyase